MMFFCDKKHPKIEKAFEKKWVVGPRIMDLHPVALGTLKGGSMVGSTAKRKLTSH